MTCKIGCAVLRRPRRKRDALAVASHLGRMIVTQLVGGKAAAPPAFGGELM